MRQYIALIHKDAGSDYGVSFPDLPGCVTAGVDLDDARRMAEEALALHLAGVAEDDEPIPEPSSLEAVMADRENRDAVAILVKAPPATAKAVRVNMTIPEDELEQIDKFAAEHGYTRSGFFLHAAKEAMREAAAPLTREEWRAGTMWLERAKASLLAEEIERLEKRIGEARLLKRQDNPPAEMMPLAAMRAGEVKTDPMGLLAGMLEKSFGTEALDRRHRDEGVRIAKKHGDTKIKTLRKIYGRSFAKGRSDDETLASLLSHLDEPSLSRLVEDDEAGQLDAKIIQFERRPRPRVLRGPARRTSNS